MNCGRPNPAACRLDWSGAQLIENTLWQLRDYSISLVRITLTTTDPIRPTDT